MRACLNRIALVLLVFAVPVVVGGCAEFPALNGLIGQTNNADFSDTIGGAGEKPQGGVPAGIRVEPVSGPTRPMGRLLASAVARELSALHISATVRTDVPALYTLRGRAILNRSAVLDPTIVLIEWQLTDDTGDLVALHTQGIRSTWPQWEYGDPAIINETGHEVARHVGTILGVEEALLTGAPTYAVNLLIRPVSGAPGDGNQALTGAVRLALRSTGISQAQVPEKASHILEGRVDVRPPLGGIHKVTITWTLMAADGRASRRVVQENTVLQGALDQKWGETADVVAWSAVPGIEEALEALLGGRS